jgi:tRNA/tmRNA/rRNA uracil-C5-methylase (TrmA/RlmC/RlmD family)
VDVSSDNFMNGWVIMVPNVIPSEVVRVCIYRNYKFYSEADLVKIITSSPDRIMPKFPLFKECGGCQYQHIPIRPQCVEQVQ